MVWLHARKFPNFNYHTNDFPQRDIVEYSDGFVVKKNLFFGYLLKIPSLSFTSWFPVKTFCLMPLTLSYIPLNFIFFIAKNGLAKCPTYNLYQCNERGGCSAWCHLTTTKLIIIILSVNVHILFLVYIAAGIAAHNRLLRRDNSRNSTQSSRRLAESRGVPWLSRHWKHFMAQELLMQSAHTHTHIHTQKYLYIYIYMLTLTFHFIS